MKLIKILFVILPTLIFTQNSLNIESSKRVYYYNSEFEQTDSINASYFKKVSFNSDFIPKGPIYLYTNDGALISKTYASYFKAKFGKTDSIIKNGPLIKFFLNKKKSSIEFFINNIQIGNKFNYNENGVLISEATFLDGELNGIEKEYYKTGELKSEKFNVNGIYEGVETGYFKSGEKKYVRNYVRGLLEGEEIAFHKNGNIFYFRNYSSGSIIGDEKGYNISGNLIYIKKHNKLNKKKIIENSANPFSDSDNLIADKIPKSLKKITFYYDSGKVKQELNYLNGLIDGLSIGYDTSGAKSYIFNFILGQKEGLSETYHKDGSVKSSCNFKSGFKDGEEVVYKKNSFKKTMYEAIVRSYDKGVLNGLETGYYDNSSVYYTQIWKNGFLNGPKVIYYNADYQKVGTVKEEYNYLNGVRDGGFSTFYLTGELETTGKYTNGVREKTIQRYYKSGNIKAEENYIEGSKEGEWVEYYESGELKSIINYEANKRKGEYFIYDITNSDIIYSVNFIDDLKHGLETNFFTSCQPKIETNYSNGLKEGEEIEYYESGEIKSKLMYVNNEISGNKISFYENSGRIKEITKLNKFLYNPEEHIATGYYDSPNSEKKYIKLFDKEYFEIKTIKYYKSGNIEYDEFFEVNTTKDNKTGKTKSTELIKNITFYHDLTKKVPSFERRFSKHKGYYGLGFDKSGNKISEVEYFSMAEAPEKNKGKEPNFHEKKRTEFYPSMNMSKSKILDLDKNGAETGYHDVESGSKLYEVNIVNDQKQGLMQYFKYNGVDPDFTEYYVDDVRLDRKLALVIGNSQYKTFPSLKNPVNDAKLLSKSLKKLGFKVIEAYNIKTRYDMFDLIDEFKLLRKDHEINLIYYAGHGISFNGKNYLIPTDEVIETSKHLERSGYSAEIMIQDLEFSKKPGQSNIVILDACRNNPLTSTRGSGSGGLTKMPSPPKGTLIAFSTKAGAVANDGDGENSLYTKTLAEKILQENISISGVFSNVRLVLDEMGVNQQPIEQSTLTGEVFLNGEN